MKFGVALVGAVVLCLSACRWQAGGARAGGAHGAAANEVHLVYVWRCAGGSSFAVYYDKDGSAVVTAASQKYVLPRAISGSGARYADGEVEFWEHQGKATLSGAAGGPYRECVPGKAGR